MKAIETRYMGPTATRGSRMLARDPDNNRVTVEYDDALSSEAMHLAVASALVHKMGWSPVLLAQGGTRDGNVFVMIPARCRDGISDGEFIHYVA